jgi:hypothetical protein
MKKITGEHLALSNIESHNHICDLAYFEYPLLSLYSDTRDNWMYMWCDQSPAGRNRWALFPVDRDSLSRYFDEEKSLQSLFKTASKHWVLEQHGWLQDVGAEKQPRRRLIAVDVEALEVYLPAKDSYFEPSLAPDIDVAEDFAPSNFAVPIKGTWFGSDFEFLFRRFEMLYAFFYSTRPQYIVTVRQKLHRLLRMPWAGGFSRMHFYKQLEREIPASHVLKVEKLTFASPGEVEFEAVASVGAKITNTTSLAIKNEERIHEAIKEIRAILTENKLSTIDLSGTSESALRLGIKDLKTIRDNCKEIAKLLDVEMEFATLQEESPNSVIYSKAVISVVVQLNHLASLSRQSMLTL